MSELRLALDWVERIEAAPTVPGAAAALLDIAKAHFGAQTLSLVTYAGRGASVQVHARMMPDGWIGSDSQRAYDRRSPLEDYCYRTRRPYGWREAMPVADRVFSPFWEYVKGHQMRDGIVVPRFGWNGALAGVSLGYEALDVPPRERRALALAARSLVDRVPMDIPDVPDLTTRERECLSWVAEGKTDWEIGQILSISQTTVKFHVDTARRKLGAATRAEAAVKFATMHWL